MSHNNSDRTEQTDDYGTAIHQQIRGENPGRSVKRVAELAVGEPTAITTDDWLVALRELAGVAVEFEMLESFCDSYLWHDGDAYRASSLASGLEHREDTPLSRSEAGALLDAAALALSEPVPLDEVDV